MCERCGDELRELHLMVQGFVWDFGPETCLLGTSPETFYKVRQGDTRAHMKVMDLHLYRN